MNVAPRATRSAVACLCVLAVSSAARAQVGATIAKAKSEKLVTTLATGTFEVKLTPLAAYDSSEGSPLGRMSIDKQFHGDLEGTSKGEMLTGMTSVKSSAGYVAIERVTGTLKGRRGSFILQHTGTMNRGTPGLVITVVPDSGTEELTGLSGSMKIIIEGAKHSYQLEYTLAGAH